MKSFEILKKIHFQENEKNYQNNSHEKADSSKIKIKRMLEEALLQFELMKNQREARYRPAQSGQNSILLTANGTLYKVDANNYKVQGNYGRVRIARAGAAEEKVNSSKKMVIKEIKRGNFCNAEQELELWNKAHPETPGCIVLRHGKPVLALPYKGEPLFEYLSKLKKDKKIVLELQLKVIDDLEALHKKGIVHHDLHINNVVVQDGEVCLIDFGRGAETEKTYRRQDDVNKLLEIFADMNSYMQLSYINYTNKNISSLSQLRVIIERQLLGLQEVSDVVSVFSQHDSERDFNEKVEVDFGSEVSPHIPDDFYYDYAQYNTPVRSITDSRSQFWYKQISLKPEETTSIVDIVPVGSTLDSLVSEFSFGETKSRRW